MAALSGPVKLFIVQRLASFDRPIEVQDAVLKTFKVKVTLPQLALYNPTQASGRELSKTLKEVFEATRAAFLKDTSSIAIAHKSYRLRMLEKMAERASDNGNAVLVAQLLEQAAKESGGLFTNKQTVEHKGKVEINNLTDDQLDRGIAELVKRLGVAPQS